MRRGGRVQAEHCSQYELKCLPGLYQDQISLLTVTSNITRRGYQSGTLYSTGIQAESSIYKQSDRNLKTSKYQAIQSTDQKLLLENFLKINGGMWVVYREPLIEIFFSLYRRKLYENDY